MRKIFYTAILVVFVALQGQGNFFRYIQPSDGLLSGEINHITQDSLGRIWIATWSGLICYDGFQFKNYRPVLGNDYSMPDKKVKYLLHGSDNNLWIATERNLVRLNLETLKFETFRFNRQDNDPVNILYLHEISGHIVIHSVEGFYALPLNQQNEDSFLINKVSINFSNKQFVYFNHSQAFDNDHFIAISNNHHDNSANVFLLRFQDKSEGYELSLEWLDRLDVRVNSIAHSSFGNEMYFTSKNGVYVFSKPNKKFTGEILFEGKSISKVFGASNNKIYAADILPQLYYYDRITQNTGEYVAEINKEGSLLNSNINTLFQDFSGVLWIGHQGQGISLLNLYPKDFVTIRRNPNNMHSLSSNAVMCFSSSTDHLIVGCRTGDINIAPLHAVQDPDNLSFLKLPEHDNTSSSNGTWDIQKQSDSLFWVAQSQGLMMLTLNRQGKWNLTRYAQGDYVFNESIREIFIDSKNNLWCGTFSSGLVVIPDPLNNPSKKHYQYQYSNTDSNTLSDNVIHHIMVDSNDRMWISTGYGLNRLKQKFTSVDLAQDPQLEFTRFVGKSITNNWLNSNEINMVYENFDGKIWVATQGGGINIYDPQSNTFSFLTSDHGLPGNDVFGMIADEENNLWISTERGLVLYEQSVNEKPITVYSHSDGIQSDVFLINSYHQDTDGRMYFGGENGFTAFYPQNITHNNIKPKILINDFRVYHSKQSENQNVQQRNDYLQKLRSNQKIILPYSNNSLSIGVAAVHYQYPEGNRITYKLEGYQDEWRNVTARARYIHYTKLPPGNYTFRVFATSTDNMISDNTQTIQIQIKPPWYKTQVMVVVFTLAGLLVLLLVVYVIINRQRQLYMHKLMNMKIENNESKMMFLANISHELRTPVSLISSPVDDLINNKTELNQKWHKHLYLIQRNSNYILKLINQIIDFRKLDAGKLKLQVKNFNLAQLIKGVIINFKSLESKKQISLQVNIPADTVMINADSQKIEEVLYNLLSNAFKHTPDGKEIIISVKTDDQSTGAYTEIEVYNQGSSIQESDYEKIFERFYKVNETDDGTGIGLSFAKSLVEMHGGTIWVNSDQNGVAFHFTISTNLVTDNINADRAETTNDYDDDQSQRHVKLTITPKHQLKEVKEKLGKVLIVEDNTDLREFMSEILSRKYTCYQAANGYEGLSITDEMSPDIIITDAVMPKLDGFAMVEKIKSDIKTCHIPIIMLTAKSENENIIEGYNAGVDAYIMKPVNTNVVLSQIDRLLKNRKLIHEKYKQQNFMVEVAAKSLSRDDVFMKKAKDIIEKHLDDPNFNVKEFSNEMHMSTTQLYRKVKALTNYSPVEFLRITRLHKAHDLLSQNNYSIKEVSYLTGFNNLSYFVKCFREYFDITPANFRDKSWPNS